MCTILYLEVCTLIKMLVRNKIEMELTYVDSYQSIIVRSYVLTEQFNTGSKHTCPHPLKQHN